MFAEREENDNLAAVKGSVFEPKFLEVIRMHPLQLHILYPPQKINCSKCICGKFVKVCIRIKKRFIVPFFSRLLLRIRQNKLAERLLFCADIVQGNPEVNYQVFIGATSNSIGARLL